MQNYAKFIYNNLIRVLKVLYNTYTHTNTYNLILNMDNKHTTDQQIFHSNDRFQNMKRVVVNTDAETDDMFTLALLAKKVVEMNILLEHIDIIVSERNAQDKHIPMRNFITDLNNKNKFTSSFTIHTGASSDEIHPRELTIPAEEQEKITLKYEDYIEMLTNADTLFMMSPPRDLYKGFKNNNNIVNINDELTMHMYGSSNFRKINDKEFNELFIGKSFGKCYIYESFSFLGSQNNGDYTGTNALLKKTATAWNGTIGIEQTEKLVKISKDIVSTNIKILDLENCEDNENEIKKLKESLDALVEKNKRSTKIRASTLNPETITGQYVIADPLIFLVPTNVFKRVKYNKKESNSYEVWDDYKQSSINYTELDSEVYVIDKIGLNNQDPNRLEFENKTIKERREQIALIMNSL